MTPARFEIRQHAVRKTEMVEVFAADGRLLAAIYPVADGLHIVSKHLTLALDMRPVESPIAVPGILIAFTEGRS